MSICLVFQRFMIRLYISGYALAQYPMHAADGHADFLGDRSHRIPGSMSQPDQALRIFVDGDRASVLLSSLARCRDTSPDSLDLDLVANSGEFTDGAESGGAPCVFSGGDAGEDLDGDSAVNDVDEDGEAIIGVLREGAGTGDDEHVVGSDLGQCGEEFGAILHESSAGCRFLDDI
ncbi:hypothetical protein AOZ07_08255 [Glutamicibacter halophytocola]|nr:hypothetical protein AOZ07_08255 [Glutamicibacter halophytocola]